MRGLFARITPQNAEAVIRDIGRAWYLLAVFQAIAALVFAGMRGTWSPYPIDSLWSLTEGYFLARRKSRAVAIAVIVPTFAIMALDISFGINPIGSTTGVVRDLIVIALAGRSLQAAVVYHRMRATRVAWTRVFVVSGASAVVTIGVVSILGIFAVNNRPWSNSELFGILDLLAFTYVPIFVVAVLTLRYPFAKTAPSSAFAGVFS
jgi:hypothetical protein